MLEQYLEDLENRLDAAVEEELEAEWRFFLDGCCPGPYFRPWRRQPAPARIEWPKIRINPALKDLELMLLRELAAVSANVAEGNGQILNIRCNYGTTILPSLFGVGLKGGLLMFIYMQFYKNLPGELEEASWLDGAGPFQTYFRIVLPSSGVVTLTVFILSVLWHWNDYLQSLMYTNTNRTLAVVMTDIDQYMYLKLQLDSTSMVNYGVPLAACILFILPPLVMYMFLQRQFIQSIDRVGIVG